MPGSWRAVHQSNPECQGFPAFHKDRADRGSRHDSMSQSILLKEQYFAHRGLGKSECRDIYVYSSVCNTSHVGNKREPLLRRLCLMGNKRERTFEFVRGQYVSVRLGTLETIDISIKTESGDPASFIRGPVTLTLHVKPVPFWF